jgi:hypothetical protein
VGWPTFDGKFVNQLRLKEEWWAYWKTYRELVGDDFVAKT